MCDKAIGGSGIAGGGEKWRGSEKEVRMSTKFDSTTAEVLLPEGADRVKVHRI